MQPTITYRTVQETGVPEDSSALITGQIEDLLGAALPGAAVESFTVTLSDQRTGDIINGREDQDILNANGSTVAVGGAFTLELAPADLVIIPEGEHKPILAALFTWTWGGTRRSHHLFTFPVVDLETVP